MSCKKKPGPIGPMGARGMKGDPGPPGTNNFIASYGQNTPDANVPVPVVAAPGSPVLSIVVGGPGSPARFVTIAAAVTVLQQPPDVYQTVEYAIRVTDADGVRIVTRTTLTISDAGEGIEAGEIESAALAARVPVAAGTVTVELLHRALVTFDPGPPIRSGAVILPTSGGLTVVETLT